MDTTSIDRRATSGEGERRVVEVTSFTDPGKVYEVDLDLLTCECPRYIHRENCQKHIILAEALLKSRSRKYRFEREIGERVVTALCKRIFAVKRESASEAFDLYCLVVGSRYSTARMRTAALRRSKRAAIIELGRLA